MGANTKDLDFKDPALKKVFVQNMLNDLKSLEQMVEGNIFETDVQRLGIEQELCLIDYNLHPFMKNLELLEVLNDSHFTTELAKFNLEINLDPLEFKGRCFSQFENNLIKFLTKANKAMHSLGGKIILAGILPTIRESDIGIDHITPIQRYIALNEAMTNYRGKEFEFNIQGVDELVTRANSVLFESCNTSFQIHYQIRPDEFSRMFNWSQAISGPVLASAVNAPLFLGKRLWKETRIALFHQSTDIRKSGSSLREERPRVFFGNEWERGSIVEHHQENLSRFKVLVTRGCERQSTELLNEGIIPPLSSLSLFNGTIYRWNRPCYGVMNNEPHLRIESRYLPSGPTIVDEIANAAFWAGLLAGLPEKYGNVEDHIEFDVVKENFMKAAKSGLNTQMTWLSGKRIPVNELILDELLPIAKDGLSSQGVNQREIEKYLGVVRQRVEKELTGSRWILKSFNNLKKDRTAEESMLAVTEGMYQRQKSGKPIHRWNDIEPKESENISNKYTKVGQVMSNDLITAGEDDLIDFIRNIMLWSGIRHVPVESVEGKLIGLITMESLLSHYGKTSDKDSDVVVAENIMDNNPVIVSPDSSIIEAIKIMRQKELSCLCVVKDDNLVGVFTEKDYIKFAHLVLQEIE